MDTLRELFEFQLRDIYYAEHRLTQALGKMIGESSDPNIKQAFVQHREETRGHVERLERLFNMLGEIPSGDTAPGIEGLIKEKEAFSQEQPQPYLLDLYNLGAGAKSERYEISSYESLIMLANALGLPHAVDILQSNLQEEQAALDKLARIAGSFDAGKIDAAHKGDLREVGFEAGLPGQRPGAIAGRDIVRDA